MMNWQMTEILVGCLLTALFLGVVLVAVQCLSSCFYDWRSNRLKTDPERLPDDYVNEIRQLLDRHKKIMSEYDFPDDHTEEESLRVEDYQLCKKHFDISSYNKVESTPRRRSWVSLMDRVLDPVELPNSLDVSVQTTSTLDRTYASMKIETTV